MLMGGLWDPFCYDGLVLWAVDARFMLRHLIAVLALW